MLRLAARQPSMARRALARAASSSQGPSSAGAEGETSSSSDEQQRLATVIKGVAGAWLAYKLLEMLTGSEKALVAPNLTLLRSHNAGNRESGIWRISNWHRSEGAMREVVAQDGVEALLAALPTAEPASRVAVVELLVRAAAVDDGRERLLRGGAEHAVVASCAQMPAGGQAARCAELAQALSATLQPAQGLQASEGST